MPGRDRDARDHRRRWGAGAFVAILVAAVLGLGLWVLGGWLLLAQSRVFLIWLALVGGGTLVLLAALERPASASRMDPATVTGALLVLGGLVALAAR